ncbi:MAG: TVP38/TMEM64 family inner membrane protein YdjZ [Peptostreptococcus russellii]|uniref:TVP38/TMEM64 family membrane protein n=1 Tax=Peptostreptococcus russellii TaxID=215200 RepID=A0A2P7Q0M2_9FIRM|nr:TVP38/TMEM64 family protein [Peptostreptococcus russellii]PSJ31523.1 membrane protein [Peptostreptococcus russellii]
MSKKLKQKILIISMIIVFILIYKVFLQGITAQSIRDWVSGFGVMAPIAYIFVWAILPIFFFPVPVLALAGGLSFGLVDGTIYTLIGAMVNSSLMFLLANILAKDMVSKYLEDKLPDKWWDRFQSADGKEGFLIVLICRLIPIMPYNVINYVSGLTKIRFSNYFLATLIGIFPGTVIFLNVGDKILDVKSPEFIMSIVFVVILTVVSVVLGKYVSKKSERNR